MGATEIDLELLVEAVSHASKAQFKFRARYQKEYFSCV